MKASSTGYGPAVMRAMENLLPEDKKLFEDPYSEKFLSPFWKFWVILMRSPKILNSLIKIREKLTPGVIGGLICRTRYIDDVLSNAIKEGAGTVVNLGAGMDTRAFRIPGIENIQYFELDFPELQKVKRAYIDKSIGELPPNVSLVPVDFNSQDIGEELQKAGYTLSSQTLFIWEGVTQYISREAVDNTLKYVARAAAGSRIVFTYVLKSFIDGSHIPDGLNSLYKLTLNKKKLLWFCGFEPAEIRDYLSQYSLHLIEDVGHEEYLERYIKPKGRDLTVFEIERTVLAEVK
ncbi:MAG: class I SAM-dependent methyltransferase [Dehalococcoidales bacterium]|nr:class I SAM-dependent methyltransferase [Dehalococcoidales bacterium]